MSLLFRLFRLFRRKPAPPQNIWKVEREENLGSYTHWGQNIHDMCKMYRIAVFERCVVTGATRVRERRDLFPVQEDRTTS